MSARTHIIMSLLGLLSVSFSSMAADGGIGIDLNGDRQGERNWNPRTGDGLLAVVSGETDSINTWSRSGNYVYEKWTARAAAYGSDSSSGDGILNPRLKGYAIEPMADVQASYQSVCTYDGSAMPCALGADVRRYSAWANVDHRVILRATVLPGIKSILDSLTEIPVYLDFALAAQITPVNSARSFAYANASFALTDNSEHYLFGDEACSGYQCNGNGSATGHWATTLQPSTADSTTRYTISVESNVGMRVFYPDLIREIEGQAIADPFLYVDPAWEYADYFVVQQESTLYPGEWVEVTRSWRESTTSIPEPGSLWLLLTGVGLLTSGYRRAKKKGFLPKLVDERT